MARIDIKRIINDIYRIERGMFDDERNQILRSISIELSEFNSELDNYDQQITEYKQKLEKIENGQHKTILKKIENEIDKKITTLNQSTGSYQNDKIVAETLYCLTESYKKIKEAENEI